MPSRLALFAILFGLTLSCSPVLPAIAADEPRSDDAQTERQAMQDAFARSLKFKEASALVLWKPDGAYARPVRSACRHESLERTLKESAPNLGSQAEALNAWIAECGQELLGPHYNGFVDLVRFAGVDYHWKDNPLIQSTQFQIEDGRKVPALIGLKRDGRIRPLIVARCGVFCNAEDGSTTSLIFMHLFEESPFNVVMLGSTTGAQFAMTNGIFTISGFDEGAQISEVVHQLESRPEIMAMTDSIHLLGISLGGLGTLYGSLFGSTTFEGLPVPVKSAVAMCPVVDLEKQLDAAFSRSWRGKFFQFLTRKVFQKVFSFVPFLGDFLKPGQKWSQDVLFRTATEGSFKYFHERYGDAEFQLEPYRGEHIRTMEDFWHMNRFEDVAEKTRIPTLVIYAKDDYLVPPRINASLLAEKQDLLPAIKTVELPGGNHCAFNISLGWPTYSSLLRTYFISHSEHPASLDMSDHPLSVGDRLRAWSWPMNLRLARGERVANYQFQLTAGSDTVRLHFWIFTPALNAGETSCSAMEPLSAPQDCYRIVTGTLPIPAFEEVGLGTPRNQVEAERMTRWLNTRGRFQDLKKADVIFSNGFPEWLSVPGRYEF